MIITVAKRSQALNEYSMKVVSSLRITSFLENVDSISNIDNTFAKHDRHPRIVPIKKQIKESNKIFTSQNVCELLKNKPKEILKIRLCNILCEFLSRNFNN